MQWCFQSPIYLFLIQETLNCYKSKQKELDLGQRISAPVPAHVYTMPVTKRQLFSNLPSCVKVLLGKMRLFIHIYLLFLMPDD